MDKKYIKIIIVQTTFYLSSFVLAFLDVTTLDKNEIEDILNLSRNETPAYKLTNFFHDIGQTIQPDLVSDMKYVDQNLITGILPYVDNKYTEEMRKAEQEKAYDLDRLINKEGGCPSIVLVD